MLSVSISLRKLNDCIFDIMLEMQSTFIAQIKNFLGKLSCGGFFSSYFSLGASIVKISNKEFPRQRKPV